MARRPYCEGGHAWEHVPAAGVERCSKCPARFPCRETCAHVDCEDKKGPPPCPVCKRPVTYEEAVHFARGERLIRVHDGDCTSKYAARHAAESSEEQGEAVSDQI